MGMVDLRVKRGVPVRTGPGERPSENTTPATPSGPRGWQPTTAARRPATTAPGAEKLFGPLRGLPAADLRQLEAIATGTNPLSRRAREALAPVVKKESFRNASPEQKQAIVRSTFNKSLAELISIDAAELQKGKRTSVGQQSRPSKLNDFDFDIEGFTHKYPAERVDITVNGRTVPVYGPADHAFATSRGATALESHSMEDVARALSMLRKEDLARVRDVRLSPVPSPSDSYWAKQYGEKGFRSYMNASAEGVITIFPWPPGEPHSARDLGANLMHELGHTASNAAWGPLHGAGRKPQWSEWQAAAKADGMPVSVYARASAEEDMAETDMLRKLTVGQPIAHELRALFPHRFELLDAHFPLEG